MHEYYREPINFLAVSTIISDVLKGVYNREAQLFPNGIDTDFYYPSEEKNNEVPIVLLVGHPSIEFKNFVFALAVLEEVAKYGIPFKVWWVAQTDVVYRTEAFGIEHFTLPSQEELAELYRKADVFLTTSLYESFALPPLEAMASGTAVLATDNGGINTYAEPGENCLLCEQGDFTTMCYALSSLLSDPLARNTLAKTGRETALKFSYKNVIPKLEMCLSRIIASSGKKCSGSE